MISSSFLTDVSNFQEFDSFHSDDDPLTSTPIKMRNELGNQYTVSPLPPSFIRADESSIADSVGENDSSVC